MGPRRERRGNTTPRPFHVYIKPLQWGRVVKDAEIGDSTRAATSSLKLQWGRVVKDAEMFEPVIDRDYRFHASMGPRRERRGNFEASHATG